MKTIYLAGSIAGCSYKEATDWRVEFHGCLRDMGMRGVSPMRAKEFLKRKRKIINGEYPEELSGSSSAIGTRDSYDVTHCDMIVAYLPKWANERRPSYGTAMEIGKAHEARVPLILVTDDAALTNHPLVQDWVGWIVPTLGDALTIIGFVLEPYLEERT